VPLLSSNTNLLQLWNEILKSPILFPQSRVFGKWFKNQLSSASTFFKVLGPLCRVLDRDSEITCWSFFKVSALTEFWNVTRHSPVLLSPSTRPRIIFWNANLKSPIVLSSKY